MKDILVFGSVAALTVAGMGCQERPVAENAATREQVVQDGSGPRCNVQGVWLLDSVIADGKVETLGSHKQMKVVAATHYSWVGQQGGRMPLVTTADSLSAYRTRGSGGGSYRLTDSSYIERLEFFSDPRQIGREVEITCRVTGNRWDASFDWPFIENGQSRTARLQEIWRRVE